MYLRNGIWQFSYYDSKGRFIRKSTKTNDLNVATGIAEEYKLIHLSKQKRFVKISNFETEYLTFVESSFSLKYLKAVKFSFKKLKENITSTYLQQLTPRELELFLIQTHRRANYTAYLIYRTLRSAFTKAIAWEYLETNPLEKIRLPKIKKDIPAFISVTELYSIIDKEPNETLKQFYTFAFNTGCRLSEVINMQWLSVDMDKKYLKVSNTETFKTKSGNERIIPINQTLFNLLIEMRPKILSLTKDNYIFCKAGNVRYNAEFISKQFKKSVRAVGLSDKIHFHSLRHSFASNLVNKGASLLAVQKILGHSDIKTTMVYSHIKNDLLYDTVKLLDNSTLSKEKANERYTNV